MFVQAAIGTADKIGYVRYLGSGSRPDFDMQFGVGPPGIEERPLKLVDEVAFTYESGLNDLLEFER